LKKPVLTVFETVIPDYSAPDSSARSLTGALERADGMILRTNIAMTRALIEKAPRLKIIARTGAGVDNVDIEAATERGILVCNTPAANNLSVAEHTLALLLGLAKDLPAMEKAVRSGAWKQRNSGAPVELAGRTLGIVGMGRIGSLVARKCAIGLGMKILAYDPYAASSFADTDYTFTPTLEALFAASDFITLHCPNIPETRGMVTRALLFSMKKSAFLINCARGGVVDEDALLEALREKRIAGAALDVLAAEPPPADSPLLKLDNVLLTPHSAALTQEASIRMASEAAQAVVDYFTNKAPKDVVNRKDLKRLVYYK
jgi:D-3-phosphoglycerate dehydrogenase